MEIIYKVAYEEQTGKITGFYVIDHPNAVEAPTPFLQIDEVLYNLCLKNSYNFIVNGEPTYVPPPPPTEEQLEAGVRYKRNYLLQESDWTQLPDVPYETKSAWAEYRQKLREVPDQPGFPREVVWPVAPN